MSNFKLDIAKLDKIIQNTVKVINDSKNNVSDIAEHARQECKKTEEELERIKQQIREVNIEIVELEADLKEKKKRLAIVSNNYTKFTQDDIKEAYEKADNIRIKLALKRQEEKHLLARRNEMEVRLRDAMRTVEKADKLMTNMTVALNCLTGELNELSSQLENIQQRQLLGFRIIKAQEEERQRVARDIHDGPAQSMSNVVLKAEICERLIDVDRGKAKEELGNLKTIVRENLQDLRKIIYNLRPMSLDDLGLVPTMERFLMNFQDETGVAVAFKTIGTCNNIKPLTSLAVFRILQEATSNVRKHAMAKSLSVVLEFADSRLRLSIFDDGKGFNVNETVMRSGEIDRGFGLLNMRERVELLGGEFSLYSKPGKGTRLAITIPLE